MTKKTEKRKLPEPVDLDLPDREYQPSKAEQEEEYDMPGAKLKALATAFFRPITKT